MLPAESGITYALGLLGERRTFDGGPERLPAGGILAGMFFSSPASKSPLERGGTACGGVCARPAKARMFSGEKGPPGKKSEPRSLDSSGKGN